MKKNVQYNEKIDLLDYLRKPEKIFGFSYVYVLIVVTCIGLLYVRNQSSIGINTIIPAIFEDSTALIQDIPLQSPRNIPPLDVMRAAVASKDLIDNGHELFEANCVSCHGEEGKGDGPSAASLDPKPRNFHSLEGWKNGPKVTQIYKTLEEGIPGSGMASYNYLLPGDRFALIHYVRTFSNGQPEDSTDDLKRLDITYSLSKGMNLPGQIPIKKTMILIEKESIPKISEIRKLRIAADFSADNGGRLFKKVVNDETKALVFVANLKDNIKDANGFVKSVSADPINAGFKPEINRISSSEWMALYRYISSIVQ